MAHRVVQLTDPIQRRQPLDRRKQGLPSLIGFVGYGCPERLEAFEEVLFVLDLDCCARFRLLVRLLAPNLGAIWLKGPILEWRKNVVKLSRYTFQLGKRHF